MTTLEARRARGDLIETFKLLKGKEDVDFNKFFQLQQCCYNLRGHNLAAYVPNVRTTIRKNFFSHRVLRSWNLLSEESVAVDTVNAFKSRIDKTIHHNQMWDFKA